MSTMEDRVNKLREERIAREKARIEKLREINLKKYPKIETQVKISTNPTKIPSTSTGLKNSYHIGGIKNIKNNFPVNGTSKRPVTAPSLKKLDFTHVKPKVPAKIISKSRKTTVTKLENHDEEKPVASTSNGTKIDTKIMSIKNSDTKTTSPKTGEATVNYKPSTSYVNRNLSTIPKQTNNQDIKKTDKNDKSNVLKSVGFDRPKTNIARKSMVPNLPRNAKSESVFSRKSMLPSFPQNAKSELASARKSTLPRFPEHTKSEPVSTRKSKLPRFPENVKSEPVSARKSILSHLPEKVKSVSVFERLYKPKFIAKKPIDEVEKLKTDPNFLKKIIKSSNSIFYKRHTCFDVNNTEVTKVLPRRSISAIHFKRISKSELGNCIHRSSSIGDKLNEGGVDLNEDNSIKEDKIVSTVKSERKKVKFMTPMSSNFNSPAHDELQSRLKSWLQKRGKSVNSYHHLQCFGIHHLKSNLASPNHSAFNKGDSKFDEENKENIALDSDSDDGSYLETMNKPEENLCPNDKIDIANWRQASFDSESVGFNESNNLNETTMTLGDPPPNVDDLLLGALNDLADLLREGFDSQQSARWLISIRERYPNAPQTAAYWECRAALEDSRGNLPASLHCWEEAIAKGTEHSVVDSNLDQLLDKFMQLKISPKSGAPKYPDPKLVDVKNIFKSTIIRFAVQQANLRQQSEQPTTPIYTVTPVRRSARLSHCRTRTPLPLCDSVRQAATIAPQHVFTPNNNLVKTP